MGLKEPLLTVLKETIRVDTIALSVSAMDIYENSKYQGRDDVPVVFKSLCSTIKEWGFNLRITFNLTKSFDKYQDCPEEIFNLGYEEYFYDRGICVIEWAQRLKSFLPKEYLRIELYRIGKNKRRIKLIAQGTRYQRILFSR